MSILKPQLFSLLLVAALILTLAALARGANCGGATACACGDTVIDSYTLTGNLTCSSTDGLILVGTIPGGKTLNCNGHTISLSPAWQSGNTDRYGIYVRGETGAQVTGWNIRNCPVSNFRVGIRVREAQDIVIADNTISNNGDLTAKVGYGLEITQNPSNVIVDGNTISGSGDEGVHDSDSDGNTYTDNTISGSGRENLYFLGTRNAVVTNNNMQDGTTAHYCKDCSEITYDGNTFDDKIVHITGASDDLAFFDGVMNGGFRVDQYEETEGSQATYRAPSNIALTDVAITASSDCLRIENTTPVTITGGSLNICPTKLNASTVDSVGVPYIRPITISFVSGINPFSGKIEADGGVNIEVAYTLNVTVQKAGPVPIENATVLLYEPGRTGAAVVNATTGVNGAIAQQTVTVQRGIMPISDANHRLVILAPGYQTYSDDLLMNADKNETITLTAQ